MADIEVNVERLGQGAEALRGLGSWLTEARAGLSGGTSAAADACGSVADGGLRSALEAFKTAWDFDIAAVGSDVNAAATAMQSIAQLYQQADAQGAQSLH